MLAVRQEEGVGGSCACRWARRERRGELCLPLGKRRNKGGVVFAVRQEEREAGSCIC